MPEQCTNPLAREILRIAKNIESAALRFKDKGKFVSVVICTHGLSTDKNGDSNPETMREYITNLKALANLPVKIVLRLCSGERKVMKLYRKVDVDCDVLGSYPDEVRTHALLNLDHSRSIRISKNATAFLGQGGRKAQLMVDIRNWFTSYP